MRTLPNGTFKVQIADLLPGSDMPSTGWRCCTDNAVAAVVMVKDDGTEVLRKACASCASIYERHEGSAWVIRPDVTDPRIVTEESFVTRVGNVTEGTVVTITEPGHQHQGDSGMVGSAGRYGSRWVLMYDLDDRPVDVELTPGTRVRVSP